MESNEQILFILSRGATKRRDILKIIYKEGLIHSTTSLSMEFKISKVAVKKYVDDLIKRGYVEKINPKSKPIFLKLTEKGTITAKKYSLY